MQTFKAYYENGRFIPVESIKIPNGSRAIVTVLDLPDNDIDEKVKDRIHAEAWREFLDEIRSINNEPVGEFERVKFREIEI